jgi:hypothetical protein
MRSTTVVAAMTERTQHLPPLGLIGLQRDPGPVAALVIRPVADAAHRLRWSLWRRRHQARARACHYDDRPPGTMKITIYGWRM